MPLATRQETDRKPRDHSAKSFCEYIGRRRRRRLRIETKKKIRPAAVRLLPRVGRKRSPHCMPLSALKRELFPKSKSRIGRCRTRCFASVDFEFCGRVQGFSNLELS